jgi:hypothetical protein
MLWGTLGWFGLLGVFAYTPDYVLAIGVLVLMGMAQMMALTSITVLLLGTTRSDMRGRVMGLRSLAVVPLLLGGTLAGLPPSLWARHSRQWAVLSLVCSSRVGSLLGFHAA